MTSRGLKILTAVAATFLVCCLLAPAAQGMEGVGAHRGSFVFFPYWTSQNPYLTVFRIVNAVEKEDPTFIFGDNIPVGEQGEGKAQPTLDNQAPIQLHFIFLTEEDGVCEEDSLFRGFTSNDYRRLTPQLLGLSNNRKGWGYAYATVRNVTPGRFRAVWDRFYSDTIVVNTAAGWARAWNNWQQWAKLDDFDPDVVAGFDADGDGVCDYARDRTDEFDPVNDRVSNDLCTISLDNIAQQAVEMDATSSGQYWPVTFPQNFYSAYLTEKFQFAGLAAVPTTFSITPIAVDRDSEEGFFDADASPDFEYDGDLYDPDENVVNFADDTITCQAVVTIHELTNNRSKQIGVDQGFVHIWSTDFNDDAAAMLTWGAFPNNKPDFAWGFYTTHDRTTVDDYDLQIDTETDDFDPDN